MANYEPASRYFQLATTTYTDPTGATFTYLTRRFLPQGEGPDLLAEVQFSAGDRLDLMAHRTIRLSGTGCLAG